MRNSLRATILTLLLAASTYAGEMQFPMTPPPPPPAPQSATTGQEPEGGEIESGQPDTTTQIILTLLNSTLSLL